MKKIATLLFFCLTFINFQTYTQDSKASFFTQQLTSYNTWLSTIGLIENLQIDSSSSKVVVEHSTIIIHLSSNYNIRALSSAWKGLDSMLVAKRQTSLAELIHQEAAFMFDLKPQQLKIYIHRKNEEPFVEIYYTNSIQEKRIAPMSQTIRIPLKELKLPANYTKISLRDRQLVKTVTQVIASNLYKYYQNKPSSLFYTLNIDTSRSFYNSLTYRITCLKNEIIQQSFLEFIELSVDVSQQANDPVEVRLIVKGKYCSGLLCPGQQEKKYYSMDDKYAEQVKAYTDFMEKRIEDWLSN